MDSTKYIFEFGGERRDSDFLVDFFHSLKHCETTTFIWEISPADFDFWLIRLKDCNGRYLVNLLGKYPGVYDLFGRPIFFSNDAPENAIEFRAYR